MLNRGALEIMYVVELSFVRKENKNEEGFVYIFKPEHKRFKKLKLN